MGPHLCIFDFVGDFRSLPAPRPGWCPDTWAAASAMPLCYAMPFVYTLTGKPY